LTSTRAGEAGLKEEHMSCLPSITDEISVHLDKIMVEVLRRIWDTADRHKTSPRTATFAVASERMLPARQERGRYP
jgi:glutamate dehydrogenase/leucine dehydrogenase